MGHVRAAVRRRLRAATSPARGARRPRGADLVRRLATLFAIGWLVESVIGFHILTTYAVCGLLVLAMRRWSTRALLRMVVVTAMFPPVLNAVMGLSRIPSRTAPSRC